MERRNDWMFYQDSRRNKKEKRWKIHRFLRSLFLCRERLIWLEIISRVRITAISAGWKKRRCCSPVSRMEWGVVPCPTGALILQCAAHWTLLRRR